MTKKERKEFIKFNTIRKKQVRIMHFIFSTVTHFLDISSLTKDSPGKIKLKIIRWNYMN